MTNDTELPPACKRVQDAASELGLEIDVVVHAQSSRTAEEAAEACGCIVGEIIKSLVFQNKDDETPILLLVSGKNRVHEKRVGRLIGCRLTRPDANYVRSVTGFAIGGIPPLGHAQRIAVYMDEDLLGYERVFAAAGTPTSVFPVSPKELMQVTGAQAICVT
ncbi:MAG: YbaK/EbsC family protein [Pseudomonadota bacterium]